MTVRRVARKRPGLLAKLSRHLAPGTLVALGCLGIVIVLAGAFALRVWDLDAADLTFDEVATVFVAKRPFFQVITYVAGAAREHPPFYYLVMSLWMKAAGTSEFAVRFPSALFGLLACAWSFRLGRQLLGKRGAWWSLLLTGVAPLSVWAGRNGRMYSLVMLLSLVIMASWLKWRRRATWRTWLVFTGLSAVGAMTHYFLVLLWAVQAVLLVVLPRRTRAIRKPWLATMGITGIALALFVAVSPGIQAMAMEVLRRFPVREFRGEDLRVLAVSLYLGGYAPELAWTAVAGAGLTAAGWIMSWRRDRLTGALFAVWCLVPLTIMHAVPENLETRYLMPIVPALLLSLAGLLASIRPWVFHLLGVAGLALLSVWRLPIYFDDPDTSFSTRIRTLSIAASPDDALVMNGPWPRLLLSYYQGPSDLDVYSVPEAAPPGFDEAVDVPRLETIAQSHERLWVSYGAVHWADPEYSVSRWLAENTYCVFEQAGMSLCLPAPDDMVVTLRSIALGSRLSVLQAAVDRQSAQVGDSVRVRLDLQGSDLDQSIGLALALLDASGDSWAEREFTLGPVHQPTDSLLPGDWAELSGLWLQPGIPPGDYVLGLRVYGSDVDLTAAATYNGWIPLSTFRVLPRTKSPELIQLLPQQDLLTPSSDTDDLSLVGIEPYATHYMEGYLAGFHLWWQVQRPGGAEQLQLRLVGPEEVPIGSFSLGPDFYPVSAWQAGDVIRQGVFFQLPDGLRSGTYRVQAQLRTQDGVPLSAEGGWRDLFDITIESRERDYHAPLGIHRRRTDFGGEIQLVGYKLKQSRLRAGDETQLTVYWRALQEPQRVYAVFNHLRAADNLTVWQEDSWPQAGIYTTDHWQVGEIVAETYTLQLPATLPPGTYRLFTGVYDPTTGDRLAATGDEAQRLLNDEVILFELEVRE